MTSPLRSLLALALALPALAQAATPEEWIIFAPEQGDFRIEVPHAPRLERDARPTPVGDVIETKYFLEYAGAELSIEIHEMPAIAAAVMPDGIILDQARDGVIDNEEGTPIAERELTFQGSPARAFTYSVPGERFEQALTVLVGKRIYLLTGTSKHEPYTHPDIERFFASFRFLPPPAD